MRWNMCYLKKKSYTYISTDFSGIFNIPKKFQEINKQIRRLGILADSSWYSHRVNTALEPLSRQRTQQPIFLQQEYEVLPLVEQKMMFSLQSSDQ